MRWMLFSRINRSTQAIDTRFLATALPKFCTICFVRARPCLESFIIYCTSCCCCAVKRFFWVSCAAETERETPLCLQLSVLRSTPHFSAYFWYGNCGPDSCDSRSSIAFSISVMVVELWRVEVWCKFGVRGVLRASGARTRYRQAEITKGTSGSKKTNNDSDLVDLVVPGGHETEPEGTQSASSGTPACGDAAPVDLVLLPQTPSRTHPSDTSLVNEVSLPSELQRTVRTLPQLDFTPYNVELDFINLPQFQEWLLCVYQDRVPASNTFFAADTPFDKFPRQAYLIGSGTGVMLLQTTCCVERSPSTHGWVQRMNRRSSDKQGNVTAYN